MSLQFYKSTDPFKLELGGELAEVELAYTTLGTLNEDKSNVVWVCHALTGNALVQDWWDSLIGEGKLFDPTRYFIVCANVLGSCYGSTGPLSINPQTGKPYYHNFPDITIRDMVAALDLLRRDLGIHRIQTCIGGSLGGQQALEWAVSQPELIENLVLLATNAQHSPWGIAFNESQRMAIATDPTWAQEQPAAGLQGMKAARAIALLSYRNYATYQYSQYEDDTDKTDHYKASSYQQYQGEKLASRFNAFSYYILSKAMDSHHVGRNRGFVAQALKRVQAKTLVIGISSDILFPVSEQQLIASNIPGAAFEEIDSLYGHDGFLIEGEKITSSIETYLFLKEQQCGV
jgi:homoserine O-acetyltransferase